jgi:hypothetical protein
MKATRRLNFVGRTLGVERMRAGAMGLTLEVMKKEMAGLRKSFSKDEEDESLTFVEELIECHINECQNLALRAEYEEKRTQTQLAVVCSLSYPHPLHSYFLISNLEIGLPIHDAKRSNSKLQNSIHVHNDCNGVQKG